jgi:hypothetical protein
MTTLSVPAQSAVDVERTQSVLEALTLLMKTAASHGATHPLALQAAGSLADRITLCSPPFTLQFIGKAFFRDRQMVPLPARIYRMAEQVARAFHRMEIHELTVASPAAPAALLRLGVAMAEADAGRRKDAADVSVSGLSWREIPWARTGAESEEVDPEVFTSAYLALAIGDAESLVARKSAPWDYAIGTAVVRRLERCVHASSDAAVRGLEMVPVQWTPARRAVAAALHVLVAFSELGVSSPAQRAAAHAVLAMACLGFEQRGGLPFSGAARAAFARLIVAPAAARSGVEPHRAKVCALAYMSFDDSGSWTRDPGVLPMLRVAYELEHGRCPSDAAFDLTLADLLALAVGSGAGLDPLWVKALVSAYGDLPPGARVRLPDGRVGLVLERSDAGPLRPRVLVGAGVLVPDGPVRLLPPDVVSGQRGGHA